MPTTTLESCAPYAQEIADMSEGARNWLYAHDNELVWRRRLDFEAAERMRAKHSADLQALVYAAIMAKRLILERKHRCRWTSILMRHFARHGIEAPDIETVRKHVKEFSGF